jgi:hypothetical protein
VIIGRSFGGDERFEGLTKEMSVGFSPKWIPNMLKAEAAPIIATTIIDEVKRTIFL